MMQFIFSAGVWDSMPEWLATILLAILHLLDQVVYSFINWMYRVFILVSEIDIFKDGTQIEAIVNRMYVIVGVAMLFIFAYNLILLIINPEGKQLGNMAKVVQNAIISVILIIFLPTIFSYLKLVQNHIVTENVIGNIVLGTTSDYDANENINKRAGVKVALDIYSAFYHPVNESYATCNNTCCPKGVSNCDGSACKGSICYDYVNAYNTAYKNSNISDFIWDSELEKGVKEGKVEYLGIVSTVAGAFALWMFISFAIDIGIRVGKLAFYEIISPIPVMMRILPGNKMFDKWFNGVKDAYLSIFIRLIVIYTCMYFISLVPDIFANLWASSRGDAGMIVALANVVVILGILQFAKDAPKLISDIFGGSGNLKFGIRNKLADNPINTPIGMVRSGIYSKAYGKTTDEDGNVINTGGFFRGAWRGRHGYEKGVATTNALIERGQSGANLGDVLKDKAKVALGLMTDYDAREFKVKADIAKEGIDVMKENNKELREQIDTLNNTIKSSIEKATSDVKAADAAVIGYEKDGRAIMSTFINGSGKRYSLRGKNYTEMLEVLEAAKRNKESDAFIGKIDESIKKWKAAKTKEMKTTVLSGKAHTISEVDKSVQLKLDYASEAIKEHVKEKGVSTYDDVDKKWETTTSSDVADADALKAIADMLDVSDIQISHRESDIKSANKEGYRAKKGSSDWVKRDSGSKGKK